MEPLTYTIVEDSLKVCTGIKERMDDFPEWKCCSLLQYAAEAIEKIKVHRPQLIFLDWALKGGSAYEVLAEIYNLKDYNPYIIFNTGYQSENPEIPQQIINNYKIDKYLVKPLWENLRLHLTEYLKEAAAKSTLLIQDKDKIWLEDINRKYHQIKMNSIVCLLQDYQNPYYKIVVLDDDLSLTVKISWPEIIELLDTQHIDFFITNSREHIIVKDFIRFYKRPYVQLHHFKQKIEVVKNKLSAFEEWMAQP